MRSRKAWMAAVCCTAWPLTAAAQVPAIPGVSAGAGAGGAAIASAGGATAVAAAPQNTIWGFLGLSKANLAACKEHLCQSQVGLLLNNLTTGPAGALSGGLIHPFCPPVLTPQQMAALPGGPEGPQAVAAAIKKSEAEAKARVAAVEYLGTVNCTYWPEATAALKNALRADPNECVRYAAARVLNSGCCCSKEIIEALKACISGEDKDGNPPETSPRVKSAAFSALQHCLMRVPEVPPEPVATPPADAAPLPRESADPAAEMPDLEREQAKPADATGTTPETTPPPPKPDRDAANRPASYATAAPARIRPTKSFAQTVAEARQTLEEVARTPAPPAFMPTGNRDLFSAFVKARRDTARATVAPAPIPAQAPAGYPATAPAPPPPPIPARPADPALRRTSYETRPQAPAPTAPAPARPQATPRGKAAPAPSASSSPARRGLLGLLIPAKSGRDGG